MDDEDLPNTLLLTLNNQENKAIIKYKKKNAHNSRQEAIRQIIREKLFQQ
jgi:hypothetical protein